jgi:DNA adenine methylase
MPADLSDILDNIFEEASSQLEKSFLEDTQSAEKVEFVCRYLYNRAGARLLLACALAKVHQPHIDIRKPYTELEDDSYSGRSYDEAYITDFVNRYDLPANPTTAFLTPALRAKPISLTIGTNLGGRPKQLYDYVLDLFDSVENGTISAEALLRETTRCLLRLKAEREQRMASLLDELRRSRDEVPLSSEEIVTLIQQHLQSPRSSRLPVLIVAAVYRAASNYLHEETRPLELHNAADERTGTLGDVEVMLINEDAIVTCYEMKLKQVTKEDIDRALQKVLKSGTTIDNYTFITTDEISDATASYAKNLYRETGGIEFAILDCIGFLRHFLHLFHRLRLQFLDAYQELVLSEPNSAVSQPLKEVFLTQRRAAESASED